MKRKIHKRSIRMMNNAGISFPVCKLNDRLLDLDSTGWIINPRDTEEEVNCKNCLREIKTNIWR
jgi:hypothetical protein